MVEQYSTWVRTYVLYAASFSFTEGIKSPLSRMPSLISKHRVALKTKVARSTKA